jgi:hypothetical protein
LLTRRARAALIGLATAVCLATAAAASADLSVTGADGATASGLSEATASADMSFATLLVAPITAGAVIVLAGVALVISATRRGSGD